jgi:hypothetical protein
VVGLHVAVDGVVIIRCVCGGFGGGGVVVFVVFVGFTSTEYYMYIFNISSRRGRRW